MDNSLTSSCSNRNYWTTGDIEHKICSANIVVFAKGTKQKPKCGFSERVISIVEKTGRRFEVVNVNEEPSIQAALRSYSGQRQLPLIYANGQLVACCNSLQRLVADGELENLIISALKN